MLTPSARQAIGEVFRPQVSSLEPGLAEELTDMILDMEEEDIFQLLGDGDALREQVQRFKDDILRNSAVNGDETSDSDDQQILTPSSSETLRDSDDESGSSDETGTVEATSSDEESSSDDVPARRTATQPARVPPMRAVRHAAMARRTTQAAGTGADRTVTGCPEEVEMVGVCCLAASCATMMLLYLG